MFSSEVQQQVTIIFALPLQSILPPKKVQQQVTINLPWRYSGLEISSTTFTSSAQTKDEHIVLSQKKEKHDTGGLLHCNLSYINA